MDIFSWLMEKSGFLQGDLSDFSMDFMFYAKMVLKLVQD